jgi:membrane carboxypeptidase/penicillin-binding protein
MDATVQRTAETVLREGLEQQERVWLEGRRLRYQRELARPEHSRAPAAGQQRMARVQRIFSNSIVVDLPGGWRADVPVPEAVTSYFDRHSGLEPGDGIDIQIDSVDLQAGRFRARVLPQQRLQGALVCLDARTGDVRAIVGGREYADPANLGYFNRAVQARRQVGSTFKPMIFASGLEHGLRPESFLSDTRIQFRDGYAPQNYDRRFMGGVTMQYSLEQSRNIPTFRIAQQLGLRRVINELRRYERGADQPWSLPLEWPIVLGTTGVTPLELAAAYHAFANGGLAKGPRLIEGVWNEERREVPIEPPPAPEQVIGATAAAQMLQMMIGVVTHGTGRELRQRLPEELRDRVAGKSGTTDDNRDAWFAGFTPWEVVVVWIGFDTPVPLSPEQTGGKSAGLIWADFLAAAWEHKQPDERQRQWELPYGLHFAEAGRRNGVPQWRLSNAPIVPEWHPPAEPQDDLPAEILPDEPTLGPELVYTVTGE